MKKLYTTYTEINYSEYRKEQKIFNNFFKQLLVAFIIVTFFVIFNTQSDFNIFGMFFDELIINLIVGLLIYIYNDVMIAINFKKLLNNKNIPLNYTINFYNEYLEIKNDNLKYKVYYDNLVSIKEAKDNFYLIIDNNRSIIVNKNNCGKNLREFLRELNTTKETAEENKEENKKVNSILMIIFLLTIISIFLALDICITIGVAKESTRAIFETMWIMWLFLPIPVMSIVLGIIYYRKNVRCVKNIVGGCVIAALLFIYGFLCFVPKVIDNYEEPTDYDLPYYNSDIPSNSI